MILMPYSTTSKIHMGEKKCELCVLCVFCDSVVRLITSDPPVCYKHEMAWFLHLKQNAVVL